MGKKSKFTGSKLLGAELRRLRGDRSLAQISALSRSEPLSERINPISAPALSQIETGVSFPSLDTLHSLATLYQTPMQQLLDFVVQERVLESTDFALPESHEEVKAAFREAFEGGRWRQAMAHAVRGEERFMVEWDRDSDVVTFGIRKFSRPVGAFLAMAGPVVRWVQHRFTEDALLRMQQEVKG